MSRKENKKPVYSTFMKNSPLIVTDTYGGTAIETLEKAGYEVQKYSMDDMNVGEDEIFEWHFSNKPKKIKFQNGYGKDVPSFLVECTIRVGTGREEWGAEPDVDYYILEIRNILI